jgi:membrane associated rhomboid family serine protease
MQRLTSSATNIIAAITALAWAIAAVTGNSDQAALALGFIPSRLSGTPVPWAAVPTILTPLTATLVHGGPIHLGFNLLIFVWCGTAVERVLGKTGLIVLYLIGAYAAALAQWALDPMGTVPMVGASGAISAVIGAFALSFGRAKAFANNLRVNRWINVVWLLVAWVVLQVMMGWLAGGQGYLLATPAHVGGFAVGLLLQRPLLLWRYRKA